MARRSRADSFIAAGVHRDEMGHGWARSISAIASMPSTTRVVRLVPPSVEG